MEYCGMVLYLVRHIYFGKNNAEHFRNPDNRLIQSAIYALNCAIFVDLALKFQINWVRLQIECTQFHQVICEWIQISVVMWIALVISKDCAFTSKKEEKTIEIIYANTHTHTPSKKKRHPLFTRAKIGEWIPIITQSHNTEQYSICCNIDPFHCITYDVRKNNYSVCASCYNCVVLVKIATIMYYIHPFNYPALSLPLLHTFDRIFNHTQCCVSVVFFNFFFFAFRSPRL